MTDNDPYSKNRKDFEKDENINVFVIMRYGPESPLVEIEDTIKETLQKYGLKAVLAKNVAFHQQLWNNVRFCMDHSRYAIIVYERILQPEFNPNVVLELGYMLALKKPCLILKEQSVPILHTDIIGRLYTPFDSYKVKETVGVAIEGWLQRLRHTSIKPAETITADTQIEANLQRTRRIITELSAVSLDNSDFIIRQAASLSSLAISDGEQHEDDSDGILQNLFMRERNKIEALLQEGAIVRLIISPDIQIERVRLRLVNSEFVKTNILARYERLISIIRTNIRKRNLQLVYAQRLRHANHLIVGESRAFIGRARLREKGFAQTTVIYDPAVVREQIHEFDTDFKDLVAAILDTDEPNEDDFGSELLKKKVIERLKESQREVKRSLNRLSSKS